MMCAAYGGTQTTIDDTDNHRSGTAFTIYTINYGDHTVSGTGDWPTGSTTIIPSKEDNFAPTLQSDLPPRHQALLERKLDYHSFQRALAQHQACQESLAWLDARWSYPVRALRKCPSSYQQPLRTRPFMPERRHQPIARACRAPIVAYRADR